eukprot:scaffold2782_cov182-Amphora_coffeaeformis.AAC.16
MMFRLRRRSRLLPLALTSWLLLLGSHPHHTAEAVRSVRLMDILNQVDAYSREDTEQTVEDSEKSRDIDDDDEHDDDYDNDDGDDVQAFYIDQSLDHFRLEDERQFKQRYFYTDRYVNPKASREYVFLCVGGEGPALSKAVLVDSVHCTGDMIETARRLYEKGDFSMHMYALEHRYYGDSYPDFEKYEKNDTDPLKKSPVTNEHLVFLSSRQAQADLAHFVASQNTALGGANLPWITFGGSYPGMMAAYARLRFPHYIAAAVSSSAPIQPTLDFAGYNNHVAEALKNEKIGGSQACLQVFVEGHADLAEQVKDTSNHARLSTDFGLCNATQLSDDPRNVQLWLGDGVTSIGTQGNDPSCVEPLCNIAKICAVLLQTRLQGATPAQALAKLERKRQELDGQECTDLSWQASIDFLSNSTLVAGGWRSWLWQTCTEFGFYQTCEVGSACPYGRGFHPLSQDLEICERAFGVRASRVATAVEESMQYYGGWHLGTTRVLSVNGDVDPWSELALQRTINDALPAFVVPGASHHFWTHPVKETDALEIVGARELIFATIEHWLDDIDDEWSLRQSLSTN